MVVKLGGHKFYRTKTNAKDARRTGEVTVPRKTVSGKRVWLNKKYKK